MLNHLNGLYTYTYFRYKCIHWYKFENDVDRILSCKYTGLSYILEYIYMMQIAKRRTSSVFAFNMQIPDQVECLVVFCMSEVNTGLVRLFAICTM